MQSQKGTSLRENTLYDVQILKLALVRFVRLTKKPKKKDNEPEQCQTGFLPRPPTSSHRDVVLHGGWPLGVSS